MDENKNTALWLERKRNLSVALILLVLGCQGCLTSGWVDVASIDAAPVTESAVQLSYEWPLPQANSIAPGYVIQISSLDPKLHGTFRVDINSTLKLPHEQSLTTSGLDESSLQAAVRSAYRGFFKSPQEIRVSVASTERLIDVQGLVVKPGQYPVHETTSIDEIIALAGGLNEKDATTKVRYLHISGTSGSGIIRLADYHSGIHALDPHWQGGERLFFQTDAPLFTYASPKDQSVVRIMGQVRAPAEYAVKPGATFFTYLLQAGGPTDRADLANITLIRSDTTSTRARAFNSQNFHDVPPIEPGDTLIVNADVATPAEKSTRVAASIASVLTSLSMLAIAML
jgi:protein involved in polysaccharide export with SLBB domain